MNAVCGSSASQVQAQIQSICGSNAEAALSAFASTCQAAGKTVRTWKIAVAIHTRSSIANTEHCS